MVKLVLGITRWNLMDSFRTPMSRVVADVAFSSEESQSDDEDAFEDAIVWNECSVDGTKI